VLKEAPRGDAKAGDEEGGAVDGPLAHHLEVEELGDHLRLAALLLVLLQDTGLPVGELEPGGEAVKEVLREEPLELLVDEEVGLVDLWVHVPVDNLQLEAGEGNGRLIIAGVASRDDVNNSLRREGEGREKGVRMADEWRGHGKKPRG